MTDRITILWFVQTIKMFTHLSTSSAKREKNLSPPHEMQFTDRIQTDFCFDCTYRLKAAFKDHISLSILDNRQRRRLGGSPTRERVAETIKGIPLRSHTGSVL